MEQKIIKQFEERFKVNFKLTKLPFWLQDNLKSLLKDTIKQVREETLQAVREEIEKKRYKHTNNQAHEKDEYWCCPDCLQDDFKNQALDDLLKELDI